MKDARQSYIQGDSNITTTKRIPLEVPLHWKIAACSALLVIARLLANAQLWLLRAIARVISTSASSDNPKVVPFPAPKHRDGSAN